MAEFIIKFTDTAEGLKITAAANPGKLDPFSAAHQVCYALQQNENLLNDFIQNAINSIKVETEPRIVNSESAE